MADNEIKTENKTELEIIINEVIKKVMGEALDLARISSMTDRNFAQYSKRMKDYTNSILIYALKVLKEKGYFEDKKN